MGQAACRHNKTMMRVRSRVFVGTLSLLAFAFPNVSSAAHVTFSLVPNETPGDTATIVEARIDPQAKELNAVDGIVQIRSATPDAVSVDVETKDSVLSMWPTTPQYSSSERVIRFTGGVPDGFSVDSVLFRMRISSSVAGPVAVSWMSGMAYLSDGRGTKEAISARSLTISLGAHSVGQSMGDVDDKASDYGARNGILIGLLLAVLLIVIRYAYTKGKTC
jgi:hypothetical protein